MHKESNEQRIKRLEGTVDALKFHIESITKQVLLLEMFVSDNSSDFYHLSEETTKTLHTIQNIYPCRRKRNQ